VTQFQLPAKYKEVTELRPGRNASVWKAINTNLDRSVFLKLYAYPENDPESALREPQLLQKLAHRHLVEIYDADIVDRGTKVLLEMELVEGGSFQDELEITEKTGIWLPVHCVIDLIHDLCVGVAHMHSNGIVHRDLKPANVLVRTKGKKRESVVTDFGLASHLGHKGRVQASQHALLYRPPEVWAGAGYSSASDVYQIGVILFQMLGGRIDYSLNGQADDLIGTAIQQGRLLLWDGFGPHLCRTLRLLIERCVGPESKRHTDLADVALELHNCKRKQANWKLASTTAGFELEREDKGGFDRITVTRSPAGTLIVESARRVHTQVFRRKAKPILLTKRDLARCRTFQNVLAGKLPG
jgi:eukaryotic-like serine/threonine-protein kinase